MSEERTIEELRKEINGKQVVWVDEDCKVNAIILAPPGENVVTVKPYGYEPEELLRVITEGGFEGFDLEKVSASTFCLTQYNTNGSKHMTTILQRVADIPNEGELNTQTISKGFEAHSSSRRENQHGAQPSCPHG